MKLLGMLLICSAALAAALSAMKTRGERIRSLRALGRMLELMEGELSSTLCPIPELLSTLEKKSGGTVVARPEKKSGGIPVAPSQHGVPRKGR